MDTKESQVGVLASWSALCASFVLSFATWVALARLAGFDGRLSWFMAVAVDGYIVSALVAWMAPVSDQIARFAKVNTYAGAGVSVLAQSAYHGLSVADMSGPAWRPYLAAVVGALPPLAAGLSVHLRALVRRASMSVRTDTDKRTPDTIVWGTYADGRTAVLDMSAPEQVVPDTVPDMDTLPAAPVSPAPRQRKPRPAPEWKVRARELIAAGLTDTEIAGKILADNPEQWNTPEAGRKAVSRLR